jgi:hypothetical protein
VGEHGQRALAADVEVNDPALAGVAHDGGDVLDRASESDPVDRSGVGAVANDARGTAVFT